VHLLTLNEKGLQLTLQRLGVDGAELDKGSTLKVDHARHPMRLCARRPEPVKPVHDNAACRY
jgi:hypothetical protein